MYSEKATKFCEISTLNLSYVVQSKVRWIFHKILWPSQKIWTLNTVYFPKTKQVLTQRARIDLKPKGFFFLFGEKNRTFGETVHTMFIRWFWSCILIHDFTRYKYIENLKQSCENAGGSFDPTVKHILWTKQFWKSDDIAF